MKNLFLVSACAIALGACGGGGGDKVGQLTALCIDEGGSSQEECTCMANAAVEKLDSELVDLLIAAAAGDDADSAMAEMMGELEPDQMQQFMTFAMESTAECEADT